jgi:hypothetical protein
MQGNRINLSLTPERIYSGFYSQQRESANSIYACDFRNAGKALIDCLRWGQKVKAEGYE